MPGLRYRRVETAYPVEEEVYRKQVEEVLDHYWTDSAKSRELGADGVYIQIPGAKDGAINAQTELLARSLRQKKKPVE